MPVKLVAKDREHRILHEVHKRGMRNKRLLLVGGLLERPSLDTVVFRYFLTVREGRVKEGNTLPDDVVVIYQSSTLWRRAKHETQVHNNQRTQSRLTHG